MRAPAREVPFLLRLSCRVEDIRSGADLSKSIEPHRKVFSDIYVSMIRAGEALHGMSIRLTLDNNLTIQDAEAVSPHQGIGGLAGADVVGSEGIDGQVRQFPGKPRVERDPVAARADGSLIGVAAGGAVGNGIGEA